LYLLSVSKFSGGVGSLHTQSCPFHTLKLFAGTFISLMIVLMFPQLACAFVEIFPLSPASETAWRAVARGAVALEAAKNGST